MTSLHIGEIAEFLNGCLEKRHFRSEMLITIDDYFVDCGEEFYVSRNLTITSLTR